VHRRPGRATENLVFCFDLASVALVHLIAERGGGSKPGSAAGLLWAAYPFFPWLSK
jgi:hypothetical protein